MPLLRRTLSIVVAGDAPPSEFRIFSAGQVSTSKGDFVFDAAAAAAVMAEYTKHGVDLMIDYDHASLASVTLDPAQTGKAAGWFNLELRGGELWAVNVRWTQSAASALSQKEWRFMSPAFSVDGDRIVSVLNVAITNMPATRNLQPLMAASKGNAMTVEEFLKVCKALAIDPTTSLDDALAKIQGTGGDSDKEDATAPAADAGADAAPETAAAAPPPPAADAPPGKEKKEDVAASAARLMRLTGATSFVAAVEMVDTFRTSHLELETERTKLASERALLESAERRKLCVELVTLGAEFPATVWADDKATTLKSRWTKMDLAELRAHTAEQRAARGGKAAKAPASAKTGSTDTPVSTDSDTVSLSASERAICDQTGCDPAVFVQLKAFRDSGKPGGI